MTIHIPYKTMLNVVFTLELLELIYVSALLESLVLTILFSFISA